MPVDVLALATAVMGLYPSVWQVLYSLATCKFTKRLLQKKKQSISNAPDTELEDFVQELNSWIELIVGHRSDLLAAFDDSASVTDFNIDSMIKELKLIVKNAQSALNRHNSASKKNNNKATLDMELAGLNKRALTIIRSFMEFMFNKFKNNGIPGHISKANTNYNQYRQLSRNNSSRNYINNVPNNINIFNFFMGDCNKESTQQQLQMVADMVNQIMKLNSNDISTNIIQCSVKPLDNLVDGSDYQRVKLEGKVDRGSDVIPTVAARRSRIQRKPSFKQVTPVQHMTICSNDEYCERITQKERRAASSFSLASTSDSCNSEEQKLTSRVVQRSRSNYRVKSTTVKSNNYYKPRPKLEAINKKMCRKSDELTLKSSYNKDQHGTYWSYNLSYINSCTGSVGALMGNKNIFELGKNVSNSEQGKLAFYTECEVLKTGTKLGLGLAVAGSSDEFKYFKKDKMAGWYNKSCGFDGRLGTFNCDKSLEIDFRTVLAPGWATGGAPHFAEGHRLGMGVRITDDGCSAEVFYTRNGAVLPGHMDVEKLWRRDWGGAPALDKADIRLVVALEGAISAVRLTFFKNIPKSVLG